jgi:hypothetical protein
LNAALSRTNGMGPTDIARKWSECSLSKEYIKMQEAERLDAEKQKPHPRANSSRKATG